MFFPLKGHSGADWPVFFLVQQKVYITFLPTKFGLSIFTVRGQKFEVSFWCWEIPNSAGRSYRPRWRLHLFTLSTWRRMLVVQRSLMRIIIRRGKAFSFSNGFWTVRTAICYNICDGICHSCDSTKDILQGKNWLASLDQPTVSHRSLWTRGTRRHLVRKDNESSPAVRSQHLHHSSALRACYLHPHT